MVYAQISNGIIQNILVLEDTSLISLFSQGFDYLVRIDNLNPVPQMGWSYNGSNFNPTSPPVISQQILYEGKIQKAIDSFNHLLVEYAASNVLLGITQAGKTQLISDTLKDVQRYGQVGSLYAAISALQAVQVTDQMSPFLTPTVIAGMISQIQGILASL